MMSLEITTSSKLIIFGEKSFIDFLSKLGHSKSFGNKSKNDEVQIRCYKFKNYYLLSHSTKKTMPSAGQKKVGSSDKPVW